MPYKTHLDLWVPFQTLYGPLITQSFWGALRAFGAKQGPLYPEWDLLEAMGSGSQFHIPAKLAQHKNNCIMQPLFFLMEYYCLVMELLLEY